MADISRFRRTLVFAAAFLLVVGCFFIGYYFFFIPYNRESLHREAFRSLRQSAANIRARNEDLCRLYRVHLRNAKKNPADAKQAFNDHNVVGTLKPDTTNSARSKDTGISVKLTRIKNSVLHYKLDADSSNNEVQLTSHDLAAMAFSPDGSYHFSNMILLHDSTVLYEQSNMLMGSQLQLDSLAGKRKIGLANVVDITLEDLDYKLFYQPFSLDDNKMYICGLMTRSAYTGRLQVMPPIFVYSLVMVAVLLLIAMPILKLFLIGPDEELRYKDMVYFIISIFSGSTILSLIIIHELFLLGMDNKIQRNLEKIATGIEHSFRTEIKEAYAQLKDIDRQFSHLPNNSLENQSSKTDTTELLREYLKGNQRYLHFDRIGWAKSSGMQVYKLEVSKKAKPLLVNVKDRDYFRQLLTRNPLQMPDDTSQFTIEGINNMVNGKYNIVLAIKSESSGLFAGISTNMYTFFYPVLPPGYNFSVIDKTGNILAQTGTRNLVREDMLQKFGNASQIKKSLLSRDSTFFSSIRMNGKDYAMAIRPVKQLPFAIITYYDKDRILSPFLRIISLTLFMMLLITAGCMFLWLAYFFRKRHAHIIVFDALNVSSWIQPHKDKVNFYLNGTLLVVIHSIVLLLLLAFASFRIVPDQPVYLMAILSPVNITLLLLLMDCADRFDTNRLRNRMLSSVGLQLSLLGILFFLTDWRGSGVIIYTYQTICTLAAVMFGISAIKKDTLRLWPQFLSKRWKMDSHINAYALFGTCFVIAVFSICPIVITWYAHNQEILQEQKQHQLDMAEAITSRKREIQRFNWADLGGEGDKQALLQWWGQKGIFSSQDDKIRIARSPIVLCGKGLAEDRLYLAFGNKVSNAFSNGGRYPLLANQSADDSWTWRIDSNQQAFYYRLPFSEAFDSKDIHGLIIKSPFPKRFEYVQANGYGLLLVLVVAFLLVGLFHLIRTASRLLFLHKFLDFTESKTALYVGVTVKPDSGSNDIHNEEARLLQEVQENVHEFAKRWNRLKPKEKYLLFDFANDGLMNPKNTTEIYNLLRTGTLVVDPDAERLKIYSPVFRAFILSKSGTNEIRELQKMHLANSPWRSFKTPLLMIMLALAAFVFFTQEAAFQKLLGLVGGFVTILNFLGGIGSKRSVKQADDH